jgi:cytochrome c oxidase subunit IV
MAEHVTSRKVYFLVFAALLVLTLATVLVAELDLGIFNDVAALGIAVTKATLVLLFFMHIRHSTRMTVLTAVSGFFWLAILFGLTIADYASRGSILPFVGGK